jgi:Putative esterase
MRRAVTLALVVVLLLSAARSPAAEPAPLEFRLAFDLAALDGPFTGRVFVMLTRQNSGELPSGISWFRPEPVFARDVTGWKPGERLTIDGSALAFPTPLKELPKGDYYVSAVMDRDLGGISFSAGEGNVYAKAARHTLDPAVSGPVALKLDRVYKARPFAETDTVKLVDIESVLLTKFHGRPMRMRAGVVLPPSFAKEPERRYPVVYSVPGFSGNHLGALRAGRAWDLGDGVEAVYVVLDPSCRLGHHVFADSANNGPVGSALVQELIPHIERIYRDHGAPGARFVTGGSSGGWSSLWLQVTYPHVFGGVWSIAPDPVDFRDFQRVDLTRPGANLFFEADEKLRPLSRAGRTPPLLFKSFSDMETVMGHGGQLESFEAVFSPRGPDGKPRRLWDRTTGAIDPEVAKSWEPYDIRLKLERNWVTLGPKLAGKLHVYMGDVDTFYLDGATRLLQKSLRDLGSDAAVELFPGRDHGTIGLAVRSRVREEMAEAYRKWQASEASQKR